MKCASISILNRFIVLSLFVFFSNAINAEEKLKPFVLAKTITATDVNKVVNSVSKKLTSNGFEIVGRYNPYKDTTILVISNRQLRAHAAQSKMGAYGAILRVTINKTDNQIQLAYTNPTYMAHVYRMKTDLADLTKQLAMLLGAEKDYGSSEGLSADSLRNYQYKWVMPYFTDLHELGDYGNQTKALAEIEKKLATKPGGASKVYRVDLTDKQESVIGIALPGPESNDCSGDQYIMSRIDFKKLKSSGHLPYEVVVSSGKVYALYAEFRIAINFPDLSMMGSNSFASIMCAPESIKSALTQAVGIKKEDDF
ncbi:MAG: hypothetical protein OEZ33_04200 [Gammaproteobacteria bacterium]|nr:hypothetical protein [Gammaproteobacteria bacterium]